MRKFLIVLAACVAAMSCSCSGDKTFGIEYALNSDGTTDGKVSLVFPNGQFSMNGTAGYQFAWTNVDNKLTVSEALPLCESLEANDAKVAKAANDVNGWLESAIRVTDAEGEYDIYVKGYVRETLTGLTFSVDKHFTSKPAE